MQNKKSFILFILAFMAFSTVTSAQSDNLKRVRIGIRALFPNIVGLHGEYILPVVNDKIGATIDFSTIPGSILSSSSNAAAYSFFSIGGNYYFGSSGEAKGFYGGLRYQNLSGSFGDTNLSVSGFGPVLGIQTGGRVFFGFEVGAMLPTNDFFIDDTELPVIPNLNITLGFAF
jgi:hypothetical protein